MERANAYDAQFLSFMGGSKAGDSAAGTGVPSLKNLSARCSLGSRPCGARRWIMSLSGAVDYSSSSVLFDFLFI